MENYNKSEYFVNTGKDSNSSSSALDLKSEIDIIDKLQRKDSSNSFVTIDLNSEIDKIKSQENESINISSTRHIPRIILSKREIAQHKVLESIIEETDEELSSYDNNSYDTNTPNNSPREEYSVFDDLRDLENADYYNLDMMLESIDGGMTENIKCMIKIKPDLLVTKIDDSNDLLMHHVARNGDEYDQQRLIEIIRLLIPKDGKNIQGENGETLLHIAVKRKLVNLVEYIVDELEIDRKIKDNNGLIAGESNNLNNDIEDNVIGIHETWSEAVKLTSRKTASIWAITGSSIATIIGGVFAASCTDVFDSKTKNSIQIALGASASAVIGAYIGLKILTNTKKPIDHDVRRDEITLNIVNENQQTENDLKDDQKIDQILNPKRKESNASDSDKNRFVVRIGSSKLIHSNSKLNRSIGINKSGSSWRDLASSSAGASFAEQYVTRQNNVGASIC